MGAAPSSGSLILYWAKSSSLSSLAEAECVAEYVDCTDGGGERAEMEEDDFLSLQIVEKVQDEHPLNNTFSLFWLRGSPSVPLHEVFMFDLITQIYVVWCGQLPPKNDHWIQKLQMVLRAMCIGREAWWLSSSYRGIQPQMLSDNSYCQCRISILSLTRALKQWQKCNRYSDITHTHITRSERLWKLSYSETLKLTFDCCYQTSDHDCT